MNSLEQKLNLLKLGRMRQVYAEWIEQAASSQMDYGEFLDQLLSEELVTRQENQLRRRLLSANFPFDASLEQFDFSRHPELKRNVMTRFFDSSFVEKAGALLLIGPSGVGKTHLAVAVGSRMAQLGYTVRFITAQKLANGVLSATNRGEVEKLLIPLIKCQLLILDELGYLPLDERIGPILFELVSERYTRGATVITSNKSLSSWGELVGGRDERMSAALLDRLTHRAHILELRGSSYRFRQQLKRGEGEESGTKVLRDLEDSVLNSKESNSISISISTATETKTESEIEAKKPPPPPGVKEEKKEGVDEAQNGD